MICETRETLEQQQMTMLKKFSVVRSFHVCSIYCIKIFNKSVKSTLLDSILKLHNYKYLSAIFLCSIKYSQKIYRNQFEKHCVSTTLFIADNFQWVQLNHILHGLIQLSCEFQLMAAMALVNFQNKVWKPTTKMSVNSWSYFQEFASLVN